MDTPKNNKGKVEMKKGPWSRDEDQKLIAYIQQHGHGSWRTIPDKAGLERCGKSCRLRWTNYLRPDIKRGKFSSHEEKSIIRLHALLGNRWSVIATHLPKRTDNEIKNYWNTRLKKRLTRMGIDPATHKPKNNPAGSAHAATLSHIAQWETTRLEAEARLARESKLVSYLRLLQRATAPPPCLRVWQSTTGALESPTSTLNFSGNSPTVPTVCSIKENDVVAMNMYGACGVGQADCYREVKDSLQLHDNNVIIYPEGYDCEMMVGSMDHASFNHDSDGYNTVAGRGEYEDMKISYWKDLLDLVSSTMDSPTL